MARTNDPSWPAAAGVDTHSLLECKNNEATLVHSGNQYELHPTLLMAGPNAPFTGSTATHSPVMQQRLPRAT